MKQLNIKRGSTAAVAKEFAKAIGLSINQAVELSLKSSNARLQRHIEGGGHPDAFRAALLLEGVSDDPR